ncbi:MAG: response regulator, partial [Nitrospira sp.]|nr:response regulator [Nitrospira sp.]
MDHEMPQVRPLALVVDDSHLERMVAREVLEEAGLRVEEAATGVAALEAFEQFHPDIILLDVVMPEMDGFSACAALRKLPHGNHTPVLMLTGLDDLASITRAYDAGATDFIVKPFNGLVLTHRVRHMLRASKTLAALRDNEASLAHAQRIARLGNWQWDITGNTLQVSEEVHRVLDMPAKNFGGTYDEFRNMVHPEDKDRLKQAVRGALNEHQPYALDYRIVLPDGSQRIL